MFYVSINYQILTMYSRLIFYFLLPFKLHTQTYLLIYCILVNYNLNINFKMFFSFQ